MDPKQNTPADPIGSGIAEDHALLQQALQHLREAIDIDDTVRTLEDLRALLERHFLEEEAPDGLAANIGDSAPQLVARLQDLLSQHSAFLETIASILQRAEAIKQSTADLRATVAHLIHDLDEHEKGETKLLVDSVYNDIGPSD